MTFPAVESAAPGLRHACVLRVPGVAVDLPRSEAMAALAPAHADVVNSLGFNASCFFTAEQIHGAGVAVIELGDAPGERAGVDGLVTDVPGALLGIYTADCCAVFLVDPVRRAIGLVHSGKKGTELGITGIALATLRARYGTDPADVLVQLSPCIRPPLYEVDFAASVRAQAAAAGVPRAQIHDSGLCTGADTARFYSYRMEHGRTGRMLSLLGFTA